MKYGLISFLFLAACTQSNKISSSISSSTLGSTVTSNRVTVIQATASDPAGVSEVDFYVNNQVICKVTQPPYNCPWTVPPVTSTSNNQYALQTKAYDPQGRMGVSQIVNVTAQ